MQRWKNLRPKLRGGGHAVERDATAQPQLRVQHQPRRGARHVIAAFARVSESEKDGAVRASDSTRRRTHVLDPVVPDSNTIMSNNKNGHTFNPRARL